MWDHGIAISSRLRPHRTSNSLGRTKIQLTAMKTAMAMTMAKTTTKMKITKREEKQSALRMSRSKGAGQRTGCVALDRIGTTCQCLRTRRRRGVMTRASSPKEGRGKDALTREEAVGEQVTNKEVEIWDQSPTKDRRVGVCAQTGSVCCRQGGTRANCRTNQTGSTCANQHGGRMCMEPGDLPVSKTTG